MERGIQIGNEKQGKDDLKMIFDKIMEILKCNEAEEETKRAALKTLAATCTVQNVTISGNTIKEVNQ